MSLPKWTRVKYQPCLPLGDDGRRVTGCKEHIELSRRAAAEGMVLLKNDGKLLPLKDGKKVAVFGKAQYDYVKGGGGSGDVTVEYVRNIYDALKEKADEGKITLFDGLIGFYKDEMEKQYAELRARNSYGICGRTTEPEIPAEVLAEAKKFTNTAIITICRFSAEDLDRKGEEYDGDFYLSREEEKMVNTVKENFSDVIVVVNAGAQTDTEWYYADNRVKSVLYSWQGGMEGGGAVADILCGDVNPSAKLVDTFAKKFSDYPSSDSFSESPDYVKYYEDIYVGYRYFETVPSAYERVNYPFGFGLSYTEFKTDGITAEVANDKIKISATVTNIGDVSGKEVVQVYYSAPQGKLGKPKYELGTFAKTKELAPNESQTLNMEFDIESMASFDDTGKISDASFVLEKGAYDFYVGNSVRNTVKTDFSYVLDNDVVCSVRSHRCPPSRLEKRMLADGSFEALGQVKSAGKTIEVPENTAKAPTSRKLLIDVYEGRTTLDEFLAQLTNDELVSLTYGKKNIGIANTAGIGSLDKYGIPPVMTADGPAGCRIILNCTAFPCATMLACTWNPELLYEVGVAGAKEVKENNLGIWLTPALNIHRNPLCGRNFEYYSEDPVISGIMASSAVKGIQSQNIAATVKHFCANNKEENRYNSDSVVSERALREVYLKGFEICVKDAQPWLLMTAYNLINGIRTSESYDLITGILRGEWGYCGAVTTDWSNQANQTCELHAGNDLRMPVGQHEDVSGKLGWTLFRKNVEASVKHILELIMKID